MRHPLLVLAAAAVGLVGCGSGDDPAVAEPAGERFETRIDAVWQDMGARTCAVYLDLVDLVGRVQAQDEIIDGVDDATYWNSREEQRLRELLGEC